MKNPETPDWAELQALEQEFAKQHGRLLEEWRAISHSRMMADLDKIRDEEFQATSRQTFSRTALHRKSFIEGLAVKLRGIRLSLAIPTASAIALVALFAIKPWHTTPPGALRLANSTQTNFINSATLLERLGSVAGQDNVNLATVFVLPANVELDTSKGELRFSGAGLTVVGPFTPESLSKAVDGGAAFQGVLTVQGMISSGKMEGTLELLLSKTAGGAKTWILKVKGTLDVPGLGQFPVEASYR